MKQIKNLLALATALTLITGCATSGYETGTKTANNIQKAADKIGQLSKEVDTTLASLNDLVTNPKPDLRPQYKTFVSNLEDLQKTGKDLTAARMAMGEKGKEFFAKWDEQLAQIHNEDIRARSESRKAEVSEKLQVIKRSYAEAEVAYRPYVEDLRDVQKFLSVDLTTGGLASIKGVVAKATAHAVPLRQSLDKLSADFKSLGVSMSAVTPAQ